ncbi:hypothetical protein EAI_02566 [Harpegnathos saltator]|uniref:Uncharacterized protein n=1 Tax=Harpegnathos saltator TaxID=610380 RepID=E2BL32_HARSA|nr:hypothetical protein EAI_02566 [Harpegnathos saltator]
MAEIGAGGGNERSEEDREMGEREGGDGTGKIRQCGGERESDGGGEEIERKKGEDRRQFNIRGKEDKMEDRERVAEVEGKKGKNVEVGYMKMWVNRRMQRWDEAREKW